MITCLAHSSKLFQVPVLIEEKKTDAVIDSGSAVNLMSETFFQTLAKTSSSSSPKMLVRVADGNVRRPTHQLTVDVRFSGSQPLLPFDFLVLPNLPFDVVLGLDFLREVSAVVVFGPIGDELRIGDTILRSHTTARLPDQPVPLFLVTDVLIPARSEVALAVRGRVKNGKPYLSSVSPTLSIDGLLGALAMSQACNGKLLVRVANITNHEYSLKKSQQIGSATRSHTADVVVLPVQLSCQIDDPFQTDLDKFPEELVSLLTAPVTGSETLQKQERDAAADSDKAAAARTRFSFGAKLEYAQREKLMQLLVEYTDIISTSEYDVGRTHLIAHEIVTGDAAPRRRHPYRLSPTELTKVESLIDRLKQHQLIRDSSSPWAAPIVIVRKKDGSLRFCCDWRDLNAVTRKDGYPLPRIDATLDRLCGMRFFTSLDFTQGYYQVPMHPDSIEKTAFVTPTGQYEFLVTGMGLTGAPATFQRLMHRMLGNLLFTNCLAYLDDVCVFSKTFEQHVDDLKQVFDRIRLAGLKIKPEKCMLATDSMKFLGHVISEKGIECDPSKVEKVQTWPIPKSKADVKSFLGFCSYYRRFIPDFSHIAYPLTQLTSEYATYEWTDSEQHAFEQLKAFLITAPILVLPDFTKPFIVCTDASGVGLGAILKQKDDKGRERVIAYASRTLLPAERRYTTSERECLALIFATKVFRPYLYGSKVTVYTDHSALTSLRNVKNPNGRLARWNLYLRDFDLMIAYKKGRANTDADALSRRGESEGRPLSDLLEHDSSSGEGTHTVGSDVDAADRMIDHPVPKSRGRDSCRGNNAERVPNIQSPLVERVPGAADQKGIIAGGVCYPFLIPVSLMTSMSCFQPPFSPVMHVPFPSLTTGTRIPDDDDPGVSAPKRQCLSPLIKSENQHNFDVDERINHRFRDYLCSKLSSVPCVDLCLCDGSESRQSALAEWKRNTTPKPCLLGDEEVEPDSDQTEYSVVQRLNPLIPRIRRAQRDRVKEPILSSCIRVLEGESPFLIPADASVKKRQQIERRAERRISEIRGSFRLNEDKLLESLSHYSVQAPQSYDRVDFQQWVICIPRSFRRHALLFAHDDLLSGHFGFKRTYERCRRHFSFPGMKEYARLFVRSCIRCHQAKNRTQPTEGALMPLSAPCIPFIRVGIDKIGPIQGSNAGFNYVFTAIDLFSKFAVASATKTATAADAADFFLQHVCAKFGFPDELLSDRGSEFMGSEFVDLILRTPTRHILSSPRHPQTNGQIERFNGILSQTIRIYRSESHSDWHTLVPFAVFAYNSSVHSVTGFSPHFLLFGSDPTHRHFARDTQTAAELLEYSEKRQRLENARLVAQKRIEVEQQKSIDRFSSKHPPPSFQFGDYVMIERARHEKGRSERFVNLRYGPFQVVRVHDNNTVTVTDSQKKEAIVNVARLTRVYKRPTHMFELEARPDDLPDTTSTEQSNGSAESDNDLFQSLIPFRWSQRARKRTNRLIDAMLTYVKEMIPLSLCYSLPPDYYDMESESCSFSLSSLFESHD